MSELVDRIRDRPHDAPLPTERLLDECAEEIERLTIAVAKISYMSAQSGFDALAMRKIATDAALWHRPNSMWWHARDDGPAKIERHNDSEIT